MESIAAMDQRPDYGEYPDNISKPAWPSRILAAMTAVGLNLALFLLMPWLMTPSDSRPSVETIVPLVNVISIKRQETEVRKKEVQRPPEEPEKRMVKRPEPAPNQIVKTKMTLPFEINPRLPSGPKSLDLPPLEISMPARDMGLPEVFSTGELDSPLTVLTRVPPTYPMGARRRNIEGWVKVAFVVDETGSVDDFRVIEASPEGVFEQSVERCVLGWRFNPGTVGGMPVKASVETTIRFELE